MQEFLKEYAPIIIIVAAVGILLAIMTFLGGSGEDGGLIQNLFTNMLNNLYDSTKDIGKPTTGGETSLIINTVNTLFA